LKAFGITTSPSPGTGVWLRIQPSQVRFKSAPTIIIKSSLRSSFRWI